jgi:hypothetical protein
MPTLPRNLRTSSRRVLVSGAGVLGALGIHALFILPFVLNLSLPAKPPDRSGAGASASPSVAEPEMTVVFMNEPLPSIGSPPPKPEVPGSRGLASPDLALVVLSPDPSPGAQADVSTTDHPESPDSSSLTSDPARQALLYGRYLGQVQARIERAWIRPRSEIGAPRFSCRARIKQNVHGDVIDVRLDHCNGTERWRGSLLSGIRTASPLPAPPDASVYADVLWLTFASEAFVEGGTPQGFEPLPPTVRMHEVPSELESPPRLADGMQGRLK